jgi:hypothetical protein
MKSRRVAVLLALALVVGAGVLALGWGRSGHPRVAAYGIFAVSPRGWHLRITRGALEAATMPLPRLGPSLGVNLSKALHAGDVGVLLFEDSPDPRELPGVFRKGRPAVFTRHDFGPPPLGGSNPGNHGYARRNFRLAGRFFDLFVESGNTKPNSESLAALNGLVRSLRLRRGDFYPGVVAPASFRTARGWSTIASGRVPVGPETSATSIASTVPYRDQLNAFPPHRTLAHLPAEGIVIFLTVTASNRDPPLVRDRSRSRSHPRLRVHSGSCGSFEGVPPRFTTCPIQLGVARQYVVSGWVLFGRPKPSLRQRARAQAELDRLALPRWPLWPIS